MTTRHTLPATPPVGHNVGMPRRDDQGLRHPLPTQLASWFGWHFRDSCPDSRTQSLSLQLSGRWAHLERLRGADELRRDAEACEPTVMAALCDYAKAGDGRRGLWAHCHGCPVRLRRCWSRGRRLTRRAGARARASAALPPGLPPSHGLAESRALCAMLACPGPVRCPPGRWNPSRRWRLGEVAAERRTGNRWGERRVRERGTVGPTCQHKLTGGGGVSLASPQFGERVPFCLFKE